MILTVGPANLSTEFIFSIPENKEKIYVYLSGGLDSAALLCLILTELKNTDRLNSTTVVCFTVVKNDGSTFYAKRIIEQIAKLFDKEIQHENNITNDVYNFKKGRVGASVTMSIWKRYKNDGLIYMANNLMAPKDIRPFNQELLINYAETELHISPFLNLHKPQILDIFFKLGCDSVIKYAHTCTRTPIGKCGQCYSCAERSWGFSALGNSDPETIKPEVTDISFSDTWVNNL